MDAKLPANGPVLFHSLKHHLRTIARFIRTRHGQPAAHYMPSIRTFGASLFDVYTGPLDVTVICRETMAWLQERNLIAREAYRQWINEQGGFHCIDLSDGSSWTLRYLEQPAFIHLHPSRHSLHTLRIKANAMKTMVCYLLSAGPGVTDWDAGTVNRIRQEYLELSPVAPGEHAGLNSVFQLLKRELTCMNDKL